jgi:hypothetical protein
LKFVEYANALDKFVTVDGNVEGTVNKPESATQLIDVKYPVSHCTISDNLFELFCTANELIGPVTVTVIMLELPYE